VEPENPIKVSPHNKRTKYTTKSATLLLIYNPIIISRPQTRGSSSSTDGILLRKYIQFNCTFLKKVFVNITIWIAFYSTGCQSIFGFLSQLSPHTHHPHPIRTHHLRRVAGNGFIPETETTILLNPYCRDPSSISLILLGHPAITRLASTLVEFDISKDCHSIFGKSPIKQLVRSLTEHQTPWTWRLHHD